jgi:hypothetical protein
MVAAAVAFVGVASLHAVTSAQKSYFTGLPLDPPAPSAPGALLHPVSVDAVSCSPNPWMLGTPLTCSNPTVHDIFSNASDRNPPLGALDWYLGTTLIATCSLAPTSRSESTCTPPSFGPPTDSALANTTQHVTVVYENASSNHFAPAPSPQFALAIFFHLQFTAPATKCVNPFTQFPPDNVEIGHPTVCTATVFNLTQGQPAVGEPVMWTADRASMTGEPFLSCHASTANYAQMIWNNPSCAPGPQLTCITDNSGQCQIVYRRLRDLTGNTETGPVGLHSLQLSAAGGAATFATDVQVITPATHPHPSTTLISCTGAASASINPSTIPIRKGRFRTNASIDVAGPTATLTCSAVVIDTDPNAAMDCDSVSPWSCSGNVDQYDAHAPLGTITWDWPGRLPADVNTCVLNRLDSYASQGPNETPFASGCALPPFTASGAGSSTLDAAYVGSTHRASQDSVPIDFY